MSTSSRRMLRVPVLFAVLFLLCLGIPAAQAVEAADVPVAQEEGMTTNEGGEAIQNEPTTTTEPPNHVKNGHEETHCAWGTACHPEYVEESAAGGHQQQQQQHANNDNNSNSNSGHIPFVHHHHASNQMAPPEGFTITARVYTDPNDKLAHFTDDAKGSHITLPYWECGATGSSTSPLPVKHAYFRHALSGSKPQVWSGAEYGPHPQLVVALKRMEMTLNSGETKILKAGDVVLLEDVVSGGHKLKAVEGFDMNYLLLTLPQHYHHVGRDQMALRKATTEKQQNPCANEAISQSSGGTGSAFVNRQPIPKQKGPGLSSKSWETILTGEGNDSSQVMARPLREPKLRKLVLGTFGVSFSAFMADVLAKIAPLWLAVGIGGTCFVVGGTAAIVQGGDWLCSEIEMYQERKRLEIPGIDDVDKDDDDMEMDMEKKPMPKPGATAA